jgi:L-ascorbate metabolism protein UlaG (beta-lactamase superfamily)
VRRVFWWLGRLGLAAFVALGLFLGALGLDGWTAFGTSATGARLERMQGSPQWSDGQFVNPEPLWNDVWGSLVGAFNVSPDGRPHDPLSVVRPERTGFERPPATGLRLTWFGHSAFLVELDGIRLLVDPVWGPRASPVSWLGPERWYDPPMALADLPAIDAVLISHDHYDHLDLPTIQAMRGWTAPFIVPLGVGAHLAGWGIPEARIIELDWWDQHPVGPVTVVATPARHASGRTGVDKDSTLWAGFAVVGSKRRVFYSGDSGLFPGLTDIGARLGPFDLTLMDAGQYDPAWPDWHMGPEQTVRAHQMVRGEVLVPVHWGLFQLAYHGWTEPIERVLAAAAGPGVRVATPRPGAPFEPLDPTAEAARWWPALPHRSAADAPVVSTLVEPERR